MRNRVKHIPTLTLVAVMLAGCGGGGDDEAQDTGSDSVTTTGASNAQTATVGMNDELLFDPTTVNARVGTVTLDVKNEGGVPHNLTFEDEALGKTGTIGGHASESLKVVFTKAGTYDFVCTFHSRMIGKVVVSGDS